MDNYRDESFSLRQTPLATRSDAARIPVAQKAIGHVFLIACLLLGTGAQLVLKFAALQVHAESATWISYAWMVSGLGLYSLATGCWVMCLAYLDLSYAYPFTGLTYALVLLSAWWLFGENLSVWRVAGISLIIIGVALIPSGTRDRP
ncbi:MAG: EamA family transporter [Deltaproteobacteria bacterium]|nr:EamA family transporter [Deltaproteobacteria bacterium]